MAKYSTLVRSICESLTGLEESEGYNSVNRTIELAIPKIFNFDFPIYDEAYRNVLCGKILKHYYMREIGAETFGLWKLWLDTRLNEIMPYYNELYRSAMIEFNPMYDVDLTTKYQRVNTGNSDTTNTVTSDNSGVSRTLFSDTPQGALDNLDNETYLTNATKVINSGNDVSESVGNTKANNTEDYLQTITGKNGGTSYSKRLKEFRETFINIDRMIIDNLADLFMNLW